MIFAVARDLRWIADAVTILRDVDAPIDWDRVVRVCRDRELTRQMGLALGYLKRTFVETLPAEPLLQLEKTRPGLASRILARALMRSDREQGYRWWIYRWALYARAAGSGDPIAMGRVAWATLKRTYRGRPPWVMPFLFVVDLARTRRSHGP
jgi:hypothetical protein